MTEVATYQPYLGSGILLQMQILSAPVTNNPRSGIYILEPGKRNDTLYIDVDAETTEDVKIPDPTYRIAPLGE